MTPPCENCIVLAICKNKATFISSFGDLECELILEYIFDNATAEYRNAPPEIFSVLNISKQSETRKMRFAKTPIDNKGILKSTLSVFNRGEAI